MARLRDAKRDRAASESSSSWKVLSGIECFKNQELRIKNKESIIKNQELRVKN